MDLEALQHRSPDALWLEAEWAINDGSPSGYSALHPVSPETRSLPPFPVGGYALAEGTVRLEKVGAAPPPHEEVFRADILPLHPDMVGHPSLNPLVPIPPPVQQWACVPSASGRTVFVLDPAAPQFEPRLLGCLKLHYAEYLGRFARPLDQRRIRAALEVTQDLFQMGAAFPPGLGFLPESNAWVATSHREPHYTVGAIFRDLRPYPRWETPEILLPFFAVFSTDRRQPEAPNLLRQWIARSGEAPWAWTLRKLIRPILEGYGFLTQQLGLIPEWNAQNLLISVNPDGEIQRLVFRDLQGTYRDLKHRPAALPTLAAGSYKVLHHDTADAQAKASRQRSYLYDFKLGEYVLLPLLKVLHRHYGLAHAPMEAAISQLFWSLCPDPAALVEDFPPAPVWYRQREGLTPKREAFFVAHTHPRFRQVTGLPPNGGPPHPRGDHINGLPV